VCKHTFTFHPLQVALLDVALRRNSVVCLGSSSAKQFLAVMLIKKLACQTRCNSSCEKLLTLALFNTGTVSLIYLLNVFYGVAEVIIVMDIMLIMVVA